MAVPGRKNSDFNKSVSVGKSEDFDHICDPCLAFDQRLEAHGFCVDCQEYLCKNCFISHQRTKASRHHQLLDKDKIDKQEIRAQTSEVCTEKCSIHKNEIIKFFCSQHQALGCTDCITLNHRSCDLDYIPDQCADIGDSDEYREVMKELTEKTKATETIMVKAVSKDKEIDEQHANATKEIDNFRKEINGRIDAIQKQSLANIGARKSSDKQKVQSVIATCNVYSSETKKLQSSLQNNKMLKQSSQLYINMKRAKSDLKSMSVEQVGKRLENVKPQFVVKRDEDIQGVLDKKYILVEIIDLPLKETSPQRMKDITSLIHVKDIKVRTDTDNKACKISGCAVLPTGEIVIADWSNMALKVVDPQRNTVTRQKTLDTEPFGITVLPHDKIAVAMPNKSEIQIISSSSDMSTHCRYKVKGLCYCIMHHMDHLYVVCQTPRRIYIMDMSGNVKKTISLEDDLKFKGAQHIAICNDLQSFYVSSWVTNTITRFTLEGEVISVYKGSNMGLTNPKGIVVLHDGSLLVCDYDGNSIYRISDDLRRSLKMTDGVDSPCSICCNRDSRKLYIGSGRRDSLKVFNLQ